MSDSPCRVDLHCHSTASQVAKLGVQRALGLPECATPPEEVYELAKRRGMDFVTITDHDTISGALDIADRPDTFVSEELTARFKGEPQAVHVLCHGITPEDHEWLQAHAGDVEECAEYLHAGEIACALAHPFFAVAAPLAPRHRRRLARLFPVWETRNGARAPELNLPAAIYIETHGGTGIAGSDDHAGIDIGRTFTETPTASSPADFLRHLREGAAEARGDQGSAAKLTHSAMGLATRALGAVAAGPPGAGPTGAPAPEDARAATPSTAAPPSPAAVLAMAERVIREGEVRGGVGGVDLGPDDASALLEAWLAATGVEMRGRDLIAFFQADEFSHAALHRRARRAHERRLAAAVDTVLAAAAEGEGYLEAALEVFAACVPAIPYVPAVAFLGREKADIVRRESEPPRVALVSDASGAVHGVARTLNEIRERGVRGFDVEVVGTDGGADRRLPTVAEVDVPFYPGLRVGVPSVGGLVECISEGRYAAIHVTAPGPAGIAAALLGRATRTPVVGSYHTELAAYAALRASDPRVEQFTRMALAGLYGQCRTVLSPSPAADRSLLDLGVDTESLMRWERGVDLSAFGPEYREEGLLPGETSVLYAGRLTTEKGVYLLAEAFLAARERDPGLHLVLAGGGPEEDALRERLGEHATFLGWLSGRELARAYASADVFLFASRTDTFGQAVLEAQASGVAVVAVNEGGPSTLIDDGRTGLLRPPIAEALAEAVVKLAASPAWRTHLAWTAAASAREHTWERSLEQLASGYHTALEPAAAAGGRRAA